MEKPYLCQQQKIFKMNGIILTSKQALELLFLGDSELWSIVVLSFSVSMKAILISSPFAMLLALALNYGNLPGKKIIVTIFNSLLSVPTVVIGLFLYVALTRNGPFGNLELLFTQSAMVIGQIVLCFPIIVALGFSAIKSTDKRLWETSSTLGVPVWYTILTVFYEARYGLFAAVITAFGRIISEVGISMMVGGNIMGYTRNITTAIALETSKGEFAQGIALGIVLVLFSFLLTAVLSYIQGKKEFI